LELKCKGQRLKRQPRARRYWKISRIEERAGEKSKRKDCGKKEETGDFSFLDLYKTKTMPEYTNMEGAICSFMTSRPLHSKLILNAYLIRCQIFYIY
jgi:hypothetical protein